MSAVSRIRALLRQADKRAAQSATNQRDKKQQDRVLGPASLGLDQTKHEEITLMGSGRAVEKVLELAAWFGRHENEEGVNVRLVTGSVFAVDDLEYTDDVLPEQDEAENGDGDTYPETRLRPISVLKAKISLK